MKHKALLSILLILMMSLTACSQSETAADNAFNDVQPTEQQVVTPPEMQETPAPSKEEKQAADTVKQEQETQMPVEESTSETEETEAPSEQVQENSVPAVNEGDIAEEETPDATEDSDGTNNYVKELEEVVALYSTMLNDETMPYNLKFIINSNTQDKIADYEELLKDGSLSEEDRTLIQQYLDELEDMHSIYADMMYKLSEGADETEAQPEEEPEPVYTPPTPPAKLTDEEVQKFLNDYLDNFKANTDMSDWSEDALAKLDENIEIIKNNPPSSVANMLNRYKNGYVDREMVEFNIWDFLEGGGYGDQEITVQ